MDELERMGKGGRRRDPNLPHAFVQQSGDELVGGFIRPSAACGLCGGSFALAIHPDYGKSEQAIRERHGPFGE